MAAVMTEDDIRHGWEQAVSFVGGKPAGTFTVAIKQTAGPKYYLLTDGCGNWYYTSEGTIRIDNELKRRKKYPGQKISL